MEDLLTSSLRDHVGKIAFYIDYLFGSQQIHEISDLEIFSSIELSMAISEGAGRKYGRTYFNEIQLGDLSKEGILSHLMEHFYNSYREKNGKYADINLFEGALFQIKYTTISLVGSSHINKNGKSIMHHIIPCRELVHA